MKDLGGEAGAGSNGGPFLYRKCEGGIKQSVSSSC